MRHITATESFFNDLQKANPRSITLFAQSMKIYTRANKLLLPYLDEHYVGLRITKKIVTDLFTVAASGSFRRPKGTLAFNIALFPKNDIYIFTDTKSIAALTALARKLHIPDEYEALEMVYEHECFHAFLNVNRWILEKIMHRLYDIAAVANAEFENYNYDKDLHDYYDMIFRDSTDTYVDPRNPRPRKSGIDLKASQELICYGLTMPKLHLLLKQIPYENTNCFEAMLNTLLDVDKDNVIGHYIRTKFNYPAPIDQAELLRLRLRLRLQVKGTQTMESGGSIAKESIALAEGTAKEYVSILIKDGKRHIHSKHPTEQLAWAAGENWKMLNPSNDYRVVNSVIFTDEFKNWFGDWENDPENSSKMVDQSGIPMVCYHGTRYDFNEFRKDWIGTVNDGGFYGRGFYFTFNSDPKWFKSAEGEASYYGKKVKKVYLRSINPFDISSLSDYKGKQINIMSAEPMVFLMNVAKMFPEIADTIFINKKVWKPELEAYEVSEVSISVLPELFKKYSAEMKTETVYDNNEPSYITGYVKSETVEFEYTDNDGNIVKSSYVDDDELGRYPLNYDAMEMEAGLIVDAISKYDGIECSYQPEGYMTRNSQITEAIKAKGHDGIMQSKYGDEIVVFEPTQIKLSDGSNVTFDPENPDIRYEQGGAIDDVSTGFPVIDKVLKEVKPYIEELVQQRIAYFNKEKIRYTETDIKYYRLDLIIPLVTALGNYLLKTDTIEDIDFSKQKGVIIMNCRIIRDNKSNYFSTQVIVAGGHNIQVRHYRYIIDTKLPRIQFSTASEAHSQIRKSLDKEQKANKEIEYYEKRIEQENSKLSSLKLLSEDQVWTNSDYSSWQYKDHSVKTQEEFDQTMKRIRTDEWDRHLRKIERIERDLNHLRKKLTTYKDKLTTVQQISKEKLEDGGVLRVGDNTNLGVIKDKTQTQYYINGMWYHKSLVKASEDVSPKTYTPQTINPNLIISAFANEINPVKLEEYTLLMQEKLLSHDFPLIKGFPSVIDENDVGQEFLNGETITDEHIGTKVWKVTDGHHRSLAAINAGLPYIRTEIDYSTITEEKDLYASGGKLSKEIYEVESECTGKLMVDYDVFLKDTELILLGIKRFIKLFHCEILPEIKRSDKYYDGASQSIETENLTYYYHSYMRNDFPMIELFNNREIYRLGFANTETTKKILSEIITEENLLPLDLSVIGGTKEFKDYFKFHPIDYIAPLILPEINERIKEKIPKNIPLFKSLSPNAKQIARYIYAAWEINAVTPHGYKSNSPYRSQLFKHKQYFTDLALKGISSQTEIKYKHNGEVGYFNVLGRQVSFHEMPYEYDGVNYQGVVQWVGIKTLCNPILLSDQQYDTMKLMAFINDSKRDIGMGIIDDVVVPKFKNIYESEEWYSDKKIVRYSGQIIPNASTTLEKIWTVIKEKNTDILKFHFFNSDKSNFSNFEGKANAMYWLPFRSTDKYKGVDRYVLRQKILAWIIDEINNGERSAEIIYDKVISKFDDIIKKCTSLSKRSKKPESIVKYENLIANTKDGKQIFIDVETNSLSQIIEMVEYKYEFENYVEVKNKIYNLLKGVLSKSDYGTNYAPTGMSRTFKDGGSIATEVLLAPNGKVSNLSTQQWHLVRTPEFKAWFGDWENDPANASKVVDENGEPQLMYHGTNNVFYIFDKNKSKDIEGRNIGMGQGKGKFYFTACYKTAQTNGSNIISAFIKIINPFSIQFYDKIVDRECSYGSSRLKRDKIIANLDKELKDEGYDGLYENGACACLKPTQIKLADGTNTTFQSNNPDIRFEDGGLLDNLINFELYTLTEHTDTDSMPVNHKIYTLKSEAIADGLSHSTHFEGEDSSVELTTYKLSFTKTALMQKLGYDLEDADDYEIDELISDYTDVFDSNDATDYDNEFVSEAKDYTAKQLMQEAMITDTNNYREKLVKDFQEKFAPHIHYEEKAGLGAVSYYAILLIAPSGKLLSNEKKLFVVALKDVAIQDYRNEKLVDLGERTLRYRSNINTENAVVQIRISDHKIKYTNEVADASLSIVVKPENQYISPFSQEGSEHPENAYSLAPLSWDTAQEYKLAYGVEESMLDVADIKNWLNDLDYNELIENRKGYQSGGVVKHLPKRIPDLINIPAEIKPVLNGLKRNKNIALFIGGCVRDALLGIEPKDIDIEVYNTDYESLEKLLSKYGKTNIVGKQFGVIKFKPFKAEYEYDFSIPRKESKIGKNHTDFAVSFDVSMTPKEAAMRRDFTINALTWNPFNNKIHDYFGGLSDLKNKVLRHTSDKFSEDALRIVRAMQFQARFGFTIAPETFKLMKGIIASGDFHQLSRERIAEEWMKWAVKGKRHNLIFDFIERSGLSKIYPDLHQLNETEQDKIYHPEGNVAEHTKLCLKEIDTLIKQDHIIGDAKAVLIFSVLLHDIGKPQTTETKLKNHRMTITSEGHESVGESMAIEFLTTIGIKESIISKVSKLVKNHLAHINYHNIPDKAKFKFVRNLAKRLHPATIEELRYVVLSDHMGRLTSPSSFPLNIDEICDLAVDVDVMNKKPEYLLKGRHLIKAGLTPSVKFSTILKAAEAAQDNQEFNDIEGAERWLAESLKDNEFTFDQGGQVSNTDKLLSASSRFRPKETVYFNPAIIGKNGNKLVSYEWSYEWTQEWSRKAGELIDKRVSDWSNAEASAETGRDLVHKYTVVRTDGVEVTVSSESVFYLLGYTDKESRKKFGSLSIAVKTLAQQRMKLALLTEQYEHYKALRSQFLQAPKPDIIEIEEPVEWMKNSPDRNQHTVYAMGDVWRRQDHKYVHPSSYQSLGYATKDTIDYLNSEWVSKRVEENKGKNTSNELYHLSRRIERQEKKVEQLSGSKIEIQSSYASGGVISAKSYDVYIEALRTLAELCEGDEKQEYLDAVEALLVLRDAQLNHWVQKDMNVLHRTIGKGKVIDVDGELLTIRFDSGTKKLVYSHLIVPYKELEEVAYDDASLLIDKAFEEEFGNSDEEFSYEETPSTESKKVKKIQKKKLTL